MLPLHFCFRIAAALVVLVVAPRILSSQAAAFTATDSLTISLDDALRLLSSRHPRQALAAASRQVVEATRTDARSARANRLLPSTNVSYGTQRLAQNQFAAIARSAGLTPVPIEQADPFTQVFASPNTRIATLSASVRPFDGGVADARVAAATHGIRAASLAEVQTRAVLEVAVIQRYADLQLQQRLLAVADSALAQANRTLTSLVSRLPPAASPSSTSGAPKRQRPRRIPSESTPNDSRGWRISRCDSSSMRQRASSCD